jgi:hypothetical protein
MKQQKKNQSQTLEKYNRINVIQNDENNEVAKYKNTIKTEIGTNFIRKNTSA